MNCANSTVPPIAVSCKKHQQLSMLEQSMVTSMAKGMTVFDLNSDCKSKAVPVNSLLNVMLRP